MTNTMLEKAALAVRLTGRFDPGGYIDNPEDVARAALQAIRDAPMSMVEEAAKQAYGSEPLPHEVMNFEGAYVAMIDAIISEGEA